MHTTYKNNEQTTKASENTHLVHWIVEIHTHTHILSQSLGYCFSSVLLLLLKQVTTQKEHCPTESETDWDKGKGKNRMQEKQGKEK